MADNKRRFNDRRERIKEFQETVIEIKRVSKKTKGGNQIGFTALVVVGDGKGRVGVGLGKAKNVPLAIRKAINRAKNRMITVALDGTTIPYPINYKHKSAHILFKPTREGAGLIAGGAVRAIASAVGIKDLVAKIIGTRNKTTNAWATCKALGSIEKKDRKIKKEKNHD